VLLILDGIDVSHSKKLYFLLGIKFIFLLLIAYFGALCLAPDEAQYWTWSQAPSLGYYSKPPAISWQIYLSTHLLGNSELGVRFGAFVIGLGLIYLVYRLSKAAGLDEKSAFWAAFVMAISPFGFYLSFAATTDAGAVLFLMAALTCIVSRIEKEPGPNYLAVGTFVALGALYKWTAFILWPILFCFLPFYPNLRKRSLWLGILLSMVAFLPVVYWNMQHDWATFRHVSKTLVGDRGASGGNFFDFFGAQLALFSPIFAILLVYGVVKSDKKRALYFLAAFPVALVLLLLLSFFKKMQPNWALYLYCPTAVFIGWALAHLKHHKRKIVTLATFLSLGGIVGALLIPLVQREALLERVALSYKINPFRQNMGTNHLKMGLESIGFDPNQDFLFADKYQNSSLLSFYSPQKQRAYFMNLGRARKNQFSYWPQMHEQVVGKTGYFVVIENKTSEQLAGHKKYYLNKLQPHFEKVEFAKEIPLFCAYGTSEKNALFFKCTGYLGTCIEDVNKY